MLNGVWNSGMQRGILPASSWLKETYGNPFIMSMGLSLFDGQNDPLPIPAIPTCHLPWERRGTPKQWWISLSTSPANE